MKPKISILIASRKNSKYLAKFLMGLYEQTNQLQYIQILCMAQATDTWNADLFQFFEHWTYPPVEFSFENSGLGRKGLYTYFNDLYKEAIGEWIIYFCDDHYINLPGWDQMVYKMIRDNQLDYRKIYCLIPKFDNVGAMNQILSRGYCEALGGYLGRHGNIDSYINDLNGAVFGDSSERILRFDDEMFHDFTHDKPDMMNRIWNKVPPSPLQKDLPKYDTDVVKALIAEDAKKLKDALERGM